MNTAVVGCGWAGRRHARSCASLGVRVLYTIDIDLARAESLARTMSSFAYVSLLASDASHVAYDAPHPMVDYHDALCDPDLDTVSICLPHDLHAQVAIDAARAGKHVLVEKPLAANLEEADRMIAAADQAGVVLMVAENVRFDPLYLKVRDLLQDGAIGELALLHMTRQCYLRDSFLRDRPWFLDAKSAAGGIMMSGGIHDFETMRVLIGEVESVYALRAPQRFLEMEGDDTSVAAIRFCNGAVGMLVESFIMKCLTTAAGSEVHTLRIDGALGHIAWEGGRTIRVFSEHERWRTADYLSQHEIDVPRADSFALLLSHFFECIETGREPITSGRSQRVPLACVMAAYESMQSGQPVTL